MKPLRWLQHRVTIRIWKVTLTLSRTRILALCSVVLTALSLWVVLGTSVCGVHEIRVQGSNRADVAQIRSYAHVANGTPLAQVDTSVIAERIEEIPQVRRAEVYRSWPRTLSVRITERQAHAYTPTSQGDGYYLLDETGVAFEESTAVPDLPQLRVDIDKQDRESIAAAVRVASALTGELRVATQYVSAASPERVQLHLLDERVIEWGDTSRSAEKLRVASVLLSRGGTEIDVSAPGVVTVR